MSMFLTHRLCHGVSTARRLWMAQAASPDAAAVGELHDAGTVGPPAHSDLVEGATSAMSSGVGDSVVVRLAERLDR